MNAAAIADAFVESRWPSRRYHYYYVRGKLASDPLYPGVVAALRGCEAPLLDLGCGIGLLAHALRADGQAVAYAGMDFDAGKIAIANTAATRAHLADAFEELKKVEILEERDQQRERAEAAAREQAELDRIGAQRARV